MSDAGFFKGTSTEQDSRFSNAQKKMMKTMRFAEGLDVKIDMTKVNLDVLKPWIAKRVMEILDVDDDVVIDFAMNQLEEKHPDPKLMQINMTGFLGGQSARVFMGQLWKLLASAQEAPDGIPQELLEIKMQELKEQQEADERLKEKIRQKEEEIRRTVLRQRSSGEVDDNDRSRHRSMSPTPPLDECGNVPDNSKKRIGSNEPKRISNKERSNSRERSSRRNAHRRHHSSSVESHQKRYRRDSRHRYHSPMYRSRYPPPHMGGYSGYRNRRPYPSPRRRTPPHMGRYYNRRRSPRDISRRRRRSSSGSRRRRSYSDHGNGPAGKDNYRPVRRDRNRRNKSSSRSTSRSTSSGSASSLDESKKLLKANIPISAENRISRQKSVEKSSSGDDEPPLKKIIEQEKSPWDSKPAVLLIPKDENDKINETTDQTIESTTDQCTVQQSPGHDSVSSAGSATSPKNNLRSSQSQSPERLVKIDKKEENMVSKEDTMDKNIRRRKDETYDRQDSPKRVNQRYERALSPPRFDLNRSRERPRRTSRSESRRRDRFNSDEIGRRRMERLNIDRNDQYSRDRGKRDDLRDDRSKRVRGDKDLHRRRKDSSMDDVHGYPSIDVKSQRPKELRPVIRQSMERQNREMKARRIRDRSAESKERIKSRERKELLKSSKKKEQSDFEDEDNKRLSSDKLKKRRRRSVSDSRPSRKSKSHRHASPQSDSEDNEDLEKRHDEKSKKSSKSKKSKKKKSKRSKKSKKSKKSRHGSSDSSSDEHSPDKKKSSKKSSRHKRRRKSSSSENESSSAGDHNETVAAASDYVDEKELREEALKSMKTVAPSAQNNDHSSTQSDDSSMHEEASP